MSEEPATPPKDSKKRLRPKTYAIGIYAVALFILVEILALACIFWFRQTVVNIETSGPVLEGAALVESREAEEPVEVKPLQPQIDARIPIDRLENKEERIAKLNGEARNFRKNNDFKLAEAALNEALAIDENHPTTLTNFAMLEEARNNNPRALEYWQRIIRQGDSAGSTVVLARERAVILEEKLRLEENAKLSGQATALENRPVMIEKVVTRPESLPDKPSAIERDFYLKSMLSPTTALQAGKLRIQLYYYDRVDANRLVPAEIEVRFLNSPPDWSRDGGVEVLRARYLASPEGAQDKRYYGYLLRVFYDGKLVEEKAEPISLLRLFPGGK